MRVATRLTLPIAAAAATASLLATVPAVAAPAAAAPAAAAPTATPWAQLTQAQKVARANQYRAQKGFEGAANWYAKMVNRYRHAQNTYNSHLAAAKAAATAVATADASHKTAAVAAKSTADAAVSQWGKLVPMTRADLNRAIQNLAVARSNAIRANNAVKAVDAHQNWIVRTRSAVVSVAKSRAGVSSYVGGGEGPYSFDCSGLTMWSYRQVGIEIPHYSGAQMVTPRAVPVALGAMVPGDLMYFGSGGSRHAAMYIGNGQVVQANNPSTGVTIDDAYAPWNMADYAGSTRLIY